MHKTISLYCLKCAKNTEGENSKVTKTKNGRIMLLSKCGCAIVENLNLSKSKKLKDY